MSGGSGLHARHQYQGGGMKDDKDDAQLCGQWHRVCELAALPEQAGRSAWLEGRVLALFRLGEHVYALDGVDPLAGVAVLGRGLVGDAGGEPVVASPLYKQLFDLATGECLEAPAQSVRTYPVRVDGGRVLVARA